MAPQTIPNWERNKSYPDADQLVSLSKLYKVNVNKLIGFAKLSFLDYPANAQNLRNYYNIPKVKEE